MLIFLLNVFFFFCLAMIGIEMKDDFLGRGEGGKGDKSESWIGEFALCAL